MDFYDLQAKDGVRFVWNSMPATKIESVKAAIPQAVHYTPFAANQVPLIQYPPLKCSCDAYLNVHSLIDFNRKSFVCPFCGSSQQLPQNYANQISPTRLPKELSEGYSSFEYKIANREQPYGYLFVIDLCLSQEQLEKVKMYLIEIIKTLPNQAYVGIVTFHKYVNVYQLPAKLNTIYCLNGTKEYQTANIFEILGLHLKNDPRGICQDISKKFIVPIGSVRQSLIRRIDDIGVDPFIYVNQRPQRAFGSALNAAISLVECSGINTRIVSFLGGPTTLGLGKVIECSYKSTLRTQDDINKNLNLELYTKASKQFESFAKRCLTKRIIVDIFAFTLEQFGLLEMRKLIEVTGGFLVMQEQFRGSVFKQSLRKLFIKDPGFGLNIATDGEIKVLASKEILVNGMLGQCFSMAKKTKGVQFSETEYGESGTNCWYIGSLDSNKTLSLVFESASKDKSIYKNYFIQFQTVYKYEGELRCRVTTVKRDFGQSLQQLVFGFDQQAAAIIIARLAIYKSIVEQQKNLSQWIDKILFKFTSHFANYVRGDVHSFSLPAQMKQFPQFIYHLRRSQLVSTFGVSPDECYYHRHYLLRETVSNAISMIQPALLQYTVDDPNPKAVMLDQQSMGDQVILLLDCYFVVMVWYGATSKDWEDKGYHQLQEYQHLQEFFNAPNQDIEYIMRSRFPSPVFYKTHPSHSKERYLKSRVNPKKTGEENQNMLTDDANIKAFTEYLIKLVVTQSGN